jgi:hypothetical protein
VGITKISKGRTAVSKKPAYFTKPETIFNFNNLIIIAYRTGMSNRLLCVVRGSIVCVVFVVDPSQTRDPELQFPKSISFTARTVGYSQKQQPMDLARSTLRKRIREIDPIIIHEMYPTIPK